MIRNGGVIGKHIEPTISSAVGIWDCHDNSTYHREDSFPNLGRVDSVLINSSASNQSIGEGWGKSMKQAEKEAAKKALTTLDENKINL